MRKIRYITLAILAWMAVNSNAQPAPLQTGQHTTKISNGEIWYDLVGDGEAPYLLMLHGGPGGTSRALYALSPLADDYTLIILDQPGTGRSGNLQDTSLMKISYFVEQLDEFTENLGLDSFILYGHSWGTMLGLDYYLAHPEKVEALVMNSPLVSTGRWVFDADTLIATLHDTIQQAIETSEKMQAYNNPEYQHAIDVYYDHFIRRGDREPVAKFPKRVPGNTLMYMYMWGPSEFRSTGNLKNYDRLDRLDEIRVPTLWVTGEFDEARPNTVKYYQSLTPGSEFAVIPGAAHATMYDNQAENVQVIRDFLEQFFANERSEQEPTEAEQRNGKDLPGSGPSGAEQGKGKDLSEQEQKDQTEQAANVQQQKSKKNRPASESKAISSDPLNAAPYHHMRSSLQNSQYIFEHEKRGRVAFLGGSITHNHGWRDSVCAYLTERFPETEFEFIAAGIPSMGSTSDAFRLERDVLSHGKPDLMFLEAAVNDATKKRTRVEQIRGMEGIARHVREVNPEADIVMMHFVDPRKIADYNEGKEPDVISNHNQVAVRYQIPTINLAKEVTDRIANHEFTWEDDFKNLHPSPFGQGVYARSIIQFLNDAWSDPVAGATPPVPHEMPAKLDPFPYDAGMLIDISKARFRKGWHVDPSWKPKDGKKTRDNYVDVPMLIATEPGSRLKLKFRGDCVGVVVAAGPDAGYLEYRVDKGEWKELNLYTRFSGGLHLPWYYTLATELSENKHVVEIRISEKQDERSTGHACRIRYFYTNRH